MTSGGNEWEEVYITALKHFLKGTQLAFLSQDGKLEIMMLYKPPIFILRGKYFQHL